MSDRFFAFLGATVIIGLIGLVYWPVHSAAFIWDDTACLNDAAALRYSDDWKIFIFNGFCDWTNYFRPLIVGLFTVEVRVFDVKPAPMHVISLAVHLANTLLLGILARKLSEVVGTVRRSHIFAALAMLIYGLHPALIEPVAWIGSRFDLAVVFWMILGLLLNMQLKRRAVRALAVAACFFLAACCKEEAVTFPLVLVLFDWLQADSGSRSRYASFRELLARQIPVYACVFAAGIGYLALRFWALGHLAQHQDKMALLSFERWQTASYTYLTYWRIIVWPMVGLNPMHTYDAKQFTTAGFATGAADVAAIAILAAGFGMAWRRKSIGYLVLVVSAALLPVLRIVPIDFVPDLYHERYAMPAIAWACVLLPRILVDTIMPMPHSRAVRIGGGLVAVVWLSLAVMNIRATLPLWSEDRKLWLWAIQGNPDSEDAKSNLLSAYVRHNDLLQARPIADALMAEPHPCALCMMNAASLWISEGDSVRASAALAKAKDVMAAEGPPSMVRMYIHTTGVLREVQNDRKGAEEAYRDAITMGPRDPKVRMSLAMLLAREGRVQEAREEAETSLLLFAPSEREEARRAFDEVLTAATNAGAVTPVPPRP